MKAHGDSRDRRLVLFEGKEKLIEGFSSAVRIGVDENVEARALYRDLGNVV